VGRQPDVDADADGLHGLGDVEQRHREAPGPPTSGFTVPNDGDVVQYRHHERVSRACRQGFTWTARPSLRCHKPLRMPLWRPASSLQPGLPCRLRRSQSARYPTDAAAFVTIPVPWSLWVLTYTAAAPSYFLGFSFTGSRACMLRSSALSRLGTPFVTLRHVVHHGVGGW